jgi:UPF0755 protein
VQRLLENDVLAGNIREIPREGTLLAGDVPVHRGTTREQMIQRMQQAARRSVQEIWDRRAPDLPIKSPEQLVVLARSSRRRPASPRSARGWRRCSSIGCARK